MGKIKTTFVINTIVSGCIATFISVVFAQGTIAEDTTDRTYVAPEFFVITAIWAVGLLAGLFIYKNFHPKLFLFISIVVTWGAIPYGIEMRT